MQARYLSAAIVGATLGTGAALQAGSGMDGDTLLGICTSGDALQKGYCIGYLAGYRDAGGWDRHAPQEPSDMGNGAETRGAEARTPGSSGYCVPPRLPHHQMREIVIAYIEEHPEDRHGSAGSIIARSLRMAFPCGSGT